MPLLFPLQIEALPPSGRYLGASNRAERKKGERNALPFTGGYTSGRGREGLNGTNDTVVAAI